MALAFAMSRVGWYFATRAVDLLRIGEPDTWFQGPVALVIGLFGQLVFSLPIAFLVVALPSLAGSSWGMRVFGIRVESLEPWRIFLRFIVAASPWWLATLALVSAWWWLAEIAIGAAAILWLGSCVAVVANRKGPADFFAGTALVESRPPNAVESGA